MSQRKNSRLELIEKRGGLHERREVPASLDWDERLAGARMESTSACETREGGEVFSALNHEDRNGEVAGKRSCVERARFRNQALGTDWRTLGPVRE
jgi:hypothetical protein